MSSATKSDRSRGGSCRRRTGGKPARESQPMHSYQSIFFGLRMQIPDGWEVKTWPDDGMKEFARDAQSSKPARSATSCGQAIRPLMFAFLYAPGNHAVIDACIEF